MVERESARARERKSGQESGGAAERDSERAGAGKWESARAGERAGKRESGGMAERDSRRAGERESERAGEWESGISG